MFWKVLGSEGRGYFSHSSKYASLLLNSSSIMADANALKDQGNKAFAAKDWDKAIDLFSQAIALDGSNHVLYSNRSAAHAGKKEWAAALKDAEKCIEINPKWSKGYARKGAALHGSKSFDEAIAAYEAGLEIEDSAPLRKGLQEVKDAKAFDLQGQNDQNPFASMFADPNLIGKLASNPRTSKHLADPSFVQKLQFYQRNPQLLDMNDPRMIDVLGVLMGIDMQGFSRPEGSDEMPPGMSTNGGTPSPPPASASSPPPPKPSTSAAQPEDVEMEEADDDEAKAQKEAEALKKSGSEAYKKRDFEEAATKFQQAWDVWPKDITFLTNLGAVYFEQGNYDQAIETCEKAVDEGRSLRADYKLIAKAYGRVGSAFQRKGDLTSAIKYYEKSLTEHRTPDILNKLREVEKAKADADKKAYIDPEKSAIAREEGNALFKKGDFAAAVKSYEEAIKRDPADARGYNNRAAAYIKLAAFPEALKDVNKAIEVDPSFVKAYIRKANVLLSMREHTKALEAVQEAELHDEGNKNATELKQLEYKIQMALYEQRGEETQEQTLERAMRDPEVANIMNDPVMQQILQQAQNDPSALQDHMKNPTVRAKIMKLVNAGIIRTGSR
ncbi:activator of Hsp70 and Hsp90 chaperone [Lentinula raphanica]|uniref:Activator of Hsp70 and Hsp90 chaperone n=1 Tax=Lentinula raphanica TaxID=153919 RepID=A0AA38P518_9AGAR|nr:activator of Hsp70 and Hsp90 chaperone [Lentinula raphanica]KAJ3975103.1 activator of Hsp70 and Hsp90 chaperone [Lentinula raphanica]